MKTFDKKNQHLTSAPQQQVVNSSFVEIIRKRSWLIIGILLFVGFVTMLIVDHDSFVAGMRDAFGLME